MNFQSPTNPSTCARSGWLVLFGLVAGVVLGIALARQDAPASGSLSAGREASGVVGRLADANPDRASASKSKSRQAPGAVESRNPDSTPLDDSSRQALAQKVAKHFSVDSGLAHTIVSHAASAAHSEGLPVSLVLAVIARESSFNPNAIRNGDLGLMQVNKKWHADKVKQAGGVRAMLNPATNIQVGVRILKQYVDASGSIREGLRRYNGMGKANQYPKEVLAYMRVFQSVA